MYIESASFKFKISLPQSVRFHFLAEMAVSLEKAVIPDRTITNPGFSLELHKNGNAEVVVWHPWRANAMWSQLRSGEQMGVISVTRPKHFSKMLAENDDA
jgi:D-hexose-6-phosphate mutarotase